MATKKVRKRTLEETISIDVCDMLRAGACSREAVAVVAKNKHYTVELAHVELWWQRTGFGGHMPWYFCRGCATRRGSLYLVARN